MKTLILLTLLFLKFNCLDRKSSSYSMNSSFSSFSSSRNGGKPETHIRSMKTEEYRDKLGDGPEQVRKYGEMFSKENDQPGILKKRANTNVEEEQMLLGNTPEESRVLKNSNEEKEFMKGFNFGSIFPFEKKDSFFGGLFDDFHMDKKIDSFNQGNHMHGHYDKFLEGKKNNLLNKIKK